MKQDIYLSVCVAIYNVSEYLTECLDSLRKQTLKEAEFILVDDGSTDGSSEICDRYAQLDNRFVVVHHAINKGLLSTRKTGALSAKGLYVVFLDGDDYYTSENSLKDLYASALLSSCDVLRFSHQVLINGRSQKVKIKKELLNKIYDSKSALELIYLENKLTWNLVFHVIRYGVIKKVFSICPDEYLISAEDAFLLFFTIYLSKKYIVIKTHPHYVYRIGSGVSTSMVTLSNFYMSVDGIRVTKWINDYFENVDDCDQFANVITSLRRKLFYFIVEKLSKIKSHDFSEAFLYLMKAGYISDLMVSFSQVFEENYALQARLANDIFKNNCFNPITESAKVVGVFYYRYYDGGVERVISKHIPILLRLGYKVVLITEIADPNLEYDLPEGVAREIVPKKYEDERADRFIEIKNKYGIDTIIYHSASSENVFFDILLFKLINVASIVMLHGAVWFNFLLSKSTKMIELELEKPNFYRLADRLIVLSSTFKPYFQAFGCNVSVLPNPISFEVDVNLIKKARERSGVLWLGRLEDKAKNWKDVLKVMHRLSEIFPDLQCYMGGSEWDPGALEYIENYLHTHNLKNKIHWIGRRNDVKDLLLNSRLTLMMSSCEAYPMSLVEAKICGIPVIAYDLPYLELLKNPRGVVVVSQHNIDDVVIHAKRIIEDDEYADCLIKESRKSIDDYYEKHNVECILDDILKAPGKTSLCQTIDSQDLRMCYELQTYLLREYFVEQRNAYKKRGKFYKLKCKVLSYCAFSKEKRLSYKKKFNMLT